MNVYVIKLSSIILTKKHITKQTNWNQHKENCNAKNCDWKQGKYIDTERSAEGIGYKLQIECRQQRQLYTKK